MDKQIDTLKHTADWVSLSTMAATVIGWLPAIAALFSIVWTGIRIYEWWRGRQTKD